MIVKKFTRQIRIKVLDVGEKSKAAAINNNIFILLDCKQVRVHFTNTLHKICEDTGEYGSVKIDILAVNLCSDSHDEFKFSFGIVRP